MLFGLSRNRTEVGMALNLKALLGHSKKKSVSEVLSGDVIKVLRIWYYQASDNILAYFLEPIREFREFRNNKNKKN